ncbi:hybrid sensor histidine kinase/response regulator transcription factor [Zobellia galactanivorans]|uniref:hybrid sensor histidine kinase/response regulator transcription factor n=1 Tax=Zobellia galactanivorans (strain DSM 12802 / CCUG 47099 / CIP 106680 / NCIMB 13871 / Dsij) TaxID=63186 RepID=UPI001C06B53E|nr:hybrid sensor histidine kinase/response regulator transcription factor [Zobellia galactanivorans]MBU3024170.1 response regulator [Zobellia galactanivorans]
MKSLVTLFLFIFYWAGCSAQNVNTHFHDLHINNSRFNKKTNVIYEDHLGYLWLGTDSGLYRYDGHAMVENQYDVFDENSIPNNSINSIIEDDYGNLWIGSESYLIRYHRKTNSFKGFYKNNTSTVLGKSNDGAIWANLRNTGIVKITPDLALDRIKFQTELNYRQKNSVWTSNKRINDFCEDLFGRAWFATPKGILMLNEENILVDVGFPKDVSFLVPSENNTFLAATEEGLFLLEYQKGGIGLKILEKIDRFKKSQGLFEFTSIRKDTTTGTIWISNRSGLYKGQRSNNSYSFSYVAEEQKTDNSPYENRINSLIIDRYNNLWVATNKGIKKHIDRNLIFGYTTFNSNQNNNFTQSLLKTGKNLMLMTLDNDGLYRFNLKTKKKQLLAASDEEYSIVKKDHSQKEILYGQGNYLLTTKNYSNKLDNIRFDTIKKYHYNVRDMVPLNHDEIWVGLWGGGIDIVTPEKNMNAFKRKAVSVLFGKNVSVMHLDHNHNLWIGTRGDGLFKINLIDEDIKVFNPSFEDGLSSNAILCLFEDEQGNIWIGTRGGGLNFYNAEEQSIKSYAKKEGLTSTTVASIAKDPSGNLWLSTRDGISRFDVKEEKFVNFGIEDGVTESHFMFNSYAIDEEEKIYFGCPGGFFSVNTQNYKKDSLAPHTIITNYTIFGDFDRLNTENNENHSRKFLNTTDSLKLPHNRNNIAFEFSSLDFTAPNKNKFAYKLEGINDFWHHTQASNRNANYNDLPPGNYIFKVKSSNSDGVWNENPATFSFTISPPYWKSTWAYLIYLLLLIISIYTTWSVIRRWYKLKKKLVAETVSREKDNEMNRMKMVFFTDISHELRTPLALILGTIEKVVKDKKFTLSPITSQRIYNNTLRMHRLINQLMDIRKFDEGKLKLQISKNDIVKDIEIIKNAFNDFAKIYEIDYEFVSEEDKIFGWYDVDILEKILFNLLSNAFKYTPKKGKIKVCLSLASAKDKSLSHKKLGSGKYIKCSVRDNGIGIPKEDIARIFDRYYQATKNYSNQIPGTGIGMELVQKLTERHYGTIEVESEENVFTEFTFYLPINKNRYHKKERINKATPLTKNFIKNSEFQVIEEVSSEFESIPMEASFTKPLVLLVEDNNDLRSMVREELKDDFNIIEACNGQEGYLSCLSQKPDLIICDILMPVEDGISMLRKLKGNTETKTIPIFMLTAKNSEETKIECLSLGADDYIEKPFSLEFVKWKVKNTFSSREDLKDRYSKIITPEPSELKVDSNDEKFIRRLIEVIEKFIDDSSLNVEFLASEVGMSRANLYRKLQAINNDTPVNFIKQIRLKRAAQLLKNNKMYISEVAYMTGFSNQKYFSKCFSKEYGMSPTEYAKQFYKDTHTSVEAPHNDPTK